MEMIKFDRHARRRMKWRNISEEDVCLVIQSPDKIEESFNGRMNAYKLIGQRNIKITYKNFHDEILIISALVKT